MVIGSEKMVLVQTPGRALTRDGAAHHWMACARLPYDWQRTSVLTPASPLTREELQREPGQSASVCDASAWFKLYCLASSTQPAVRNTRLPAPGWVRTRRLPRGRSRVSETLAIPDNWPFGLPVLLCSCALNSCSQHLNPPRKRAPER